MKIRLGKICLALSVLGSPYAVKDACAGDTSLFIPSVYALESDWKNTEHDFSGQNNAIMHAPQTLQTSVGDDAVIEEQETLGYTSQAKKSKDKNFAEKVLDKLPYKHTLRYTWNVLDGDEDIVVTGLRADVRNKGIRYKTNHIPFAGKVDGTNIKAEMGDDQRLTFESDHMPFKGRVDGFKFKASVGDDAKLSLRYRQKIEAPNYTEYQSSFRR